jgi:hypothetical protein
VDIRDKPTRAKGRGYRSRVTDQRISTAGVQVAHRAADDVLSIVDSVVLTLADQLDMRGPVARAGLLSVIVERLGLELRAAGRDTIDEYVAERAAEGASKRGAVAELGAVIGMSRSATQDAFGRRTDRPVPDEQGTHMVDPL